MPLLCDITHHGGNDRGVVTLVTLISLTMVAMTEGSSHLSAKVSTSLKATFLTLRMYLTMEDLREGEGRWGSEGRGGRGSYEGGDTPHPFIPGGVRPPLGDHLANQFAVQLVHLPHKCGTYAS